jgi:hypothetical protein
MRLGHRWVLVILLCTLISFAQQPATGKTSDPATGTVTGHVYLNDTKGPARKATVYLQPVASLQVDTPDRGRRQDNGDVKIGVQTIFDGSFSFTNVAAGVYYVIASYPGYVSPYVMLALADARSPYGEWHPLGPSQLAAKKAILQTIPQITVQPGRPVTVDVSLERGAAISGNITYDDGSPAAGLDVTLLARMLQDGKETWAEIKPLPDSPFVEVHTDDRGDYRFSGLPAGKYIVRMTLSLVYIVTQISSSSTSVTNGGGGYNPVTIYSGGTPRLKDATSFTLLLGDERTGENFRIPLSKFHTITGNIVSAHDGHTINRGRVYLNYADDRFFAGSADISQEAPTFTFNFVYEGEYILTTPMAADVDDKLLAQQPGSSSPQYDSPAIHLYGSASMPLHVDGDMDGVTISVPEPTAKEAQIFRNALQRQEQQNQSPAPKQDNPR